MTIDRKRFHEMLENSQKKTIYWQNTGFYVKHLNGKYVLVNTFKNNEIMQFLNEDNEIINPFKYNDFFN